MWEEEAIERILFYRNAAEHSDKIYLLQIIQGGHEDSWIVKAYWGKRVNPPQQSQKKIKCGRLEAERQFNMILEAKIKKGYKLGSIEFAPPSWHRYLLTKVAR